MKILLSPAKSLDFSIELEITDYTLPQFAKDSKEIMKVLKKMSPNDLSKLMHVSSDLAELNFSRNRQWKFPSELNDLNKQAAFVFTGEVYRGLDFSSLNHNQIVYAQENLKILSGLYGILRPLDLIFAYRLEMGTKLAVNDKDSNLYQFWRTKLTKHLNKELTSKQTIVNLASNEYSKAVDFKEIKSKIITPNFKDFKNGEYKVVMMYAKNARGKMARYIIENEIEDVNQLKLYDIDGYTYNETLSTDTDWIYTR